MYEVIHKATCSYPPPRSPSSRPRQANMNCMFSNLSEREKAIAGSARQEKGPRPHSQGPAISQISAGARLTERPRLRYKDVFIKDMRTAIIKVND
ncbi:hypothetical protein CHS0354_034398 [Potamilus streckersoni]|uniref:Uncharacterized protein n=1 Tax=Potamilus streckersoni TaxID=2493646 RepID=A0AAE0S8V2_9BIVA|nr:hypothetical protein CHS0354_034398 [Potamilus streckersoni]